MKISALIVYLVLSYDLLFAMKQEIQKNNELNFTLTGVHKFSEFEKKDEFQGERFIGKGQGRYVQTTPSETQSLYYFGQGDNHFRLFEPIEKELYAFPISQSQVINSVCYNSCHSLVACASSSGFDPVVISLFNTKNQKKITDIPNKFFNGSVFVNMALSGDAKYLVATPSLGDFSKNVPLVIFDVDKAEKYASLLQYREAIFKPQSNTSWNTSTFTSNFYLLAVAGDSSNIHVYECLSQRERMVLRGHTGTISSISFRPDNRYLASVSSDKTLRVWDIPILGEHCIKNIVASDEHEITAVAWSPDGKYIVTGDDHGTIKIWDFDSAQCLQILTNQATQETPVYYLQWDKEGTIMSQHYWYIICFWGQKK